MSSQSLMRSCKSWNNNVENSTDDGCLAFKVLEGSKDSTGAICVIFELRICGSGHFGLENQLVTKKRPTSSRQNLLRSISSELAHRGYGPEGTTATPLVDSQTCKV